MSGTEPGPGSDELLAIADRVAGWAGTGEEVEVFLRFPRARDGDPGLRRRGGVADLGDLGRHRGPGGGGPPARFRLGRIAGGVGAGRDLGRAWDNASFASPDEHVQLAVPDGVAAVPVDLWDEALASVPTADKVELALALEAQARAADPRIRQVSSADYGDDSVEAALVSTTGIRASSRKTSGYLSVGVIAGDGDESQTGGGFSVGRGFAGLDPDKATTDAVKRSVRLLGATKGQSGRTTVVFDRRIASTLLSVVSSALSGEAVAKGRSFFAGRIGEVVGDPVLTLVDDPPTRGPLGPPPTTPRGWPAGGTSLSTPGSSGASSTTRCRPRGRECPPPVLRSGAGSPARPARGAGR